jgi:hypothetical protein
LADYREDDHAASLTFSERKEKNGFYGRSVSIIRYR